MTLFVYDAFNAMWRLDGRQRRLACSVALLLPISLGYHLATLCSAQQNADELCGMNTGDVSGIRGNDAASPLRGGSVTHMVGLWL